MPIFRAHTCSTLTVPDRQSRSTSKGSVRSVGSPSHPSPGHAGLGFRASSPSAPDLRRSSPSPLPRGRFSSESRPSRGTASTGLDAFLSERSPPTPSRPSSSASHASLRSLSSQNLSSISSPVASPLASASPSSALVNPRPKREGISRGSKERNPRCELKDLKEPENREAIGTRDAKEGKSKEGNGRGSIQLPHLKPMNSVEFKEPKAQDGKEVTDIIDVGPLLPRPKTVGARMERMERDPPAMTPSEQLVNLFSGATRKARPRPEQLEMPSSERFQRPERSEGPPEHRELIRPSSKYKSYGKGMNFGRRPPTSPVAPTVSLKKIQKLEEGQKIFDLYYWEEILQQEGDGGKVVVCRPKEENQESNDNDFNDRSSFRFVMKIKSKEALRQDLHEEQFLRAQTRLLNLKAPPGVIQLQEILEDENFYYVVMDRATGGSFFSSLLEEYRDGTMPASAVCKVARDILETLRYLHKEGILHRDIKPDNMVMHSHFDESGKKLQKVTLIDFDHADAEFSGLGLQVQHCFGTARFNAPEAFLGFYSAATDLYSVGVIVYLLLTGSMPYPSELFEFPMSPGSPSSPAANRRWMKQVVAQMEAHQIDWSHPTFQEIPESKDFCQQLLAFNMVDRSATAEEALRHPWMSSGSLE